MRGFVGSFRDLKDTRDNQGHLRVASSSSMTLMSLLR
jgi:hypothetical protein